MTNPEDLARVRAEIRARREARTRERIRGLRAANPHLPIKHIAYHAGVSTGYAENVLGETSPPEGIIPRLTHARRRVQLLASRLPRPNGAAAAPAPAPLAVTSTA